MKKILIILMLCISACFSNIANAVEINVEGKGYASLTGYDIKAVRNMQDSKMNEKARNSNFEVLQTQQIKEAARQAETRKKQDKRMSNAVRRAVVVEAQDNAKRNAITILVDRTLGANASKNPKVMEKFNDLLSQSSTYILNQNFGGEIEDNNYVATAYLTVDETAFRTLLSDLGIALNTQKTRQSSILLVLDEFFAAPSNMNANVATKEVTTYTKNKDTKYLDKEAYKHASSVKAGQTGSGSYSGGGMYGGGGGGYHGASAYSGKEGTSYGKYTDFSDKQNEFYQHIVEYAPKSPVVGNLNYTQPALQNAFTTYDIRSLDNDVFKSKYLKGMPITSDQLSNSGLLANYVSAARKDAKADFFAIGVAYITDNGVSPYTGKNVCDGNVYVKIYSTVDSEVIAAGTFTETAAGNSADQARAAVANKIGNELGEVLSKKVQDYWKRRMMYGSEYIVQIRGNFLPVERVTLNQAIKSVDGIQNVNLRSSDGGVVEFTVNYNGQEPAGDAIFMKLYNSGVSAKIRNYDYKTNGNQIIFAPLGKVPNL